MTIRYLVWLLFTTDCQSPLLVFSPTTIILGETIIESRSGGIGENTNKGE